MKKTRKRYDLEFKKKIISEYLTGKTSAQDLADREGLERAQIYTWKTQLEKRAKKDRFEELVAEGRDPDDVRRIIELEEEIEAYKSKVAELVLMNDLLKKVHPNFQSEKKFSGYSELKKKAHPFLRRVK